MKNKEILNKLIDTWGAKATFYVLACGSIGLGAGIIFGVSTMHNLMLTDCEITEKEK